MRNKRIVLTASTSWHLYNYRSNLIRALLETGYKVIVLAPKGAHSGALSELGCEFNPIKIDSAGINPGKDLFLLWRYREQLKNIRPHVFLGYTIKPNIFGSIAANSLKIPVINNISGLGSAFINDGWLTRIVEGLYRIALRRSFRVFLQNPDDQALFIGKRI